MKTVRLVLLVSIITMIPLSNPLGRTWHVDSYGSGDAPTIQAAIDSSTVGDTVLVDPGAYMENIVITSASNGVVITSVSGPNSTTIASAGAGAVVDFSGVDSSTVLSGFRLTGGTGAANPEDPGTFHGGGIRIFYCSPRITGNEIVNNRVEPGRGGGIQCFGSAAIIESNLISNNFASFHGGGIHVEHGSPRIKGNIIEDNETPGGGSLTAYYSTIEILDNIFRKNIAWINGGAIVVDHCNVVISGNLVYDNHAHSIGGGIFLFACSGELDKNTIALNKAGSSGGLAFLGGDSPTVSNNIVACNVAQNTGGVGCDETTSPDFSCNDVWNNSPGNYGANCGDLTGTAGNISADPQFCDLYNNVYSLATGSPALIQGCGAMGAVPDSGCDSADLPSCEFPVGAESKSWGSIKTLYKKGTE